MEQRINTLVGIACIGCAVTGIAAFIAALFPFTSGEFLPAAVFLVAAGLSFGLLAIALVKR